MCQFNDVWKYKTMFVHYILRGNENDSDWNLLVDAASNQAWLS
jgi:hypothetical protein